VKDDLRRHHLAIWAAIDEIAARRGISTSRLAILSGGDSTAFNPSKRVKDGRCRWPSTERVAMVLTFAGMSHAEFGAIIDEKMKA
jgi:phage repressor protein C with HTH and peptisase S24 domain